MDNIDLGQLQETHPWDVSSGEEDDSIDSEQKMEQQLPAVDVDLEEEHDLPAHLDDVLQGLRRWPWTVYPGALHKCLLVAVKAATTGTENFILKHAKLQLLYSEAVPGVFDKCFEDSNVKRWNDGIQLEIYNCLLALMDLLRLKIPQVHDPNMDGEVVENLLSLMKCLGVGMEKESHYQQKHKEDDLRLSWNKSIEEKYASQPVNHPEPDQSGEWQCALSRQMVKEPHECGTCEGRDGGYLWLIYALNYFGNCTATNEKSGYEILAGALVKAYALSTSPALMEAMLQPIAKTLEFLTDEALAWFKQPVQDLLRQLADDVEKKLDSLSDKTGDGTFAALSQTLKYLQLILARVLSPGDAESVVSAVQRRMVERMLSFPSFNKQLSAVREINKLLENIRAVTKSMDSHSVSATIEWLESKEILRHALHSHLHHKQYVDQVEKIMLFLLSHKRLSEEHLDGIWTAIEKPDQFEAVKNNIFDLLVNLACSFGDDQLDSLFKRLERSQGRSSADTLKFLQLVKKLADSDAEGAMAYSSGRERGNVSLSSIERGGRILELLWHMLHVGDATTEILESGVFTKILDHYEAVHCAYKDVYIKRCVDMVESQQSVIPSLRLFCDIIAFDRKKMMEEERRVRIQALNNDYHVIDKMVHSLEVYLGKGLGEVGSNGEASRGPMADATRYSREDHLSERCRSLLWTLQKGEVKLEWELTARLWSVLIEEAGSSTARLKGFNWFLGAVDKWAAISDAALGRLLAEKISNVDPAELPLAGWQCFQRVFVWVNLFSHKLKHVRDDGHTVSVDLNLHCLDYMWKIALLTPSEEIASLAIGFLRDLHTCLAENLESNVLPIRQQFVDTCFHYLTTAVEACGVWSPRERMASAAEEVADVKMEIQEGTDKGSTEGDMSIEGLESVPERLSPRAIGDLDQVERCLRLLQTFITKCEGRCPRVVASHGACFEGRPQAVTVDISLKKNIVIHVHVNDYLKSLRLKVADALACEMHAVRLVVDGRELVQDWQLIRQCGIEGNTTVTATVNRLERVLDVREEEQQLPGVLISRQREIYEILFRLLESSNSGAREAAESLLMLLPTNPDTLQTFIKLREMPQAAAEQLLATELSSRPRLLYTLQVLDGMLMPVNHTPSCSPEAFRRDFLRCGGFRCLLGVFLPGALPDSVDDRTRRGCYSSGLRLLRFLLTQHRSGLRPVAEKEALPESDGTCLIRADGSVVIENGKEEDDVDVVVVAMDDSCIEEALEEEPLFEGGSGGEMGAVVGVLTNLAWATAIGHIGAMRMHHPIATYFVRNLEHPKRRRGNNASSSFSHDDNWGQLESDDAYLCDQALHLLGECLLKHKGLLAAFFTSPTAPRFIVDTVLFCPSPTTRFTAADILYNLSVKALTESDTACAVPKHLLRMLLSSKGETEKRPRQCQFFMVLMTRLVSCCDGEEDMNVVREQMREEVQWLKQATAVTEEADQLLTGHLQFTTRLVELINADPQTARSDAYGEGLIQMVVGEFLFPESVLLAENRERLQGRAGPTASPLKEEGEESKTLPQAKCGTGGTRGAAFGLLVALAKNDVGNLREVVELLLRLHFSEEWTQEMDHLPAQGHKSFGGYVGLKNAGATCYMNSVFQQLFMQPQVRASLLACSEPEEQEKKDSVFFQLQAMFGSLLGSSLDHYIPEGFWMAYRDYDGHRINLREHQDAFEFFNRLYDFVDETLKAIPHHTTLTAIFGGCFAQQIICCGCPHQSEREEPFAAISVDVKNKMTLGESLESFVRGDLLENDNAYYCEECGRKVDALKRVCVKALPHTLVIHLKRFDFDYETMQRLKVKDRFEFPVKLDMKPYTAEGLAMRESKPASQKGGWGRKQEDREVSADSGSGVKRALEATASSGMMGVEGEGEGSPGGGGGALKPEWYYQYELVGVVVHSGTAFAGHYYSYIKEREEDKLSGESKPGGTWVVFDDKRVEEYDVNDLEKDCYGGKYTVDVYDSVYHNTMPQEYDRPNSAYMLLYERTAPDCLKEGQTQSTEAAAPETSRPVLRQTCGGVTKRDVQMPPSIHRGVWEENIRFLHDHNLFSAHYFHFLQTLIAANMDTVKASSAIQGARGARLPLDTAQGREVSEIAELSLRLGTEFLCQVYLRAASSLRGELGPWLAQLQTLVESGSATCAYFHAKLALRPDWVRTYLLQCPTEEVRQMFATLLIASLKTAIRCLGGKLVALDPAGGRAQDVLHCDQLVGVLLKLVEEPQGYRDTYYVLINHFCSVSAAMSGKLDFSGLHTLVADLARSCDPSHIYERESESDSEEAPPSSEQNPYQLIDSADSAGPLPEDAYDAIVKKKYLSALVRTASHTEEVVDLFCFLSWRNHGFSRVIVADVLTHLRSAEGPQLQSMLQTLNSLLSIYDNLQTRRLEQAVLGGKGGSKGIISLIVQQNVSDSKRYCLIKFVVEMNSGTGGRVYHLVMQRASEWEKIVEWLDQKWGSGTPVVGHHLSNDTVMSPDRLLRTNSLHTVLRMARQMGAPRPEED